MSVKNGQRSEIKPTYQLLRQNIPTNVVRFHATAGCNRRTCAVSHFGGNLLPAAVLAPAVAICLKSLLITTRHATSFPGSTPLSRWRLREDPGTHRYDTHVDWSEDLDILTLVVIGRNCLSCKMTDLCSCTCYFLCN